MKNDGIHPIIIDAGDLFFSKDDPDPLDLAQSKIRAKTIIEGYNSIGCEVMNLSLIHI